MEENEVNWKYYEKDKIFKIKEGEKELINDKLKFLINCFKENIEKIYPRDKSTQNKKSNEVLEIIRNDLEEGGYKVERKENKDRIYLLEGQEEIKDKRIFQVDALSKDKKILVEIEAGRGYANNQFLKDFYEAILSESTEYLVIAVKNIYTTTNKKNNKTTKHHDYQNICKYFDILTKSKRGECIPLKGILVIGY